MSWKGFLSSSFLATSVTKVVESASAANGISEDAAAAVPVTVPVRGFTQMTQIDTRVVVSDLEILKTVFPIAQKFTFSFS